MTELIESLGEYIILVIVGSVFIVGMTFKTITTIVSSIGRERSRREIAAYIAEGSISPEQGEKLMKADVDSDKKNCRA